MKILYKILNRLDLLKYINVTSRISVKNKTFRIPLINGLGLENLNHKTCWIEHLLSNFEEPEQALGILDIGVNVGQTLLSVKSLNANWTYVGFEPNPNCVYYVNKLIKANQFSNATIFPIAVSDKINILDLYLNHATDSTATTLDTFRPNRYIDGYKEQIISFDLDTLIQTCLKLDKIDIIKIDIEGSELSALKGAKSILKLHQPLVICEVLDTHSLETLDNHKKSLKSLQTLLQEIDYRIYQIHRNEDDTNVLDLRPIDAFEVKIWQPESLKLNDYLFVPNNRISQFRAKFNLQV